MTRAQHAPRATPADDALDDEPPTEADLIRITEPLRDHLSELLSRPRRCTRGLDQPREVGLGLLAQEWRGVNRQPAGGARQALIRRSHRSAVAAARDDDAILAYLRQQAGTNYHPCCTCRMGAGPDAVVDARGRVNGFDNLRVIDASIMPEIVSGNLNAPVIMMAEKLADDILGRPPLPPEPAPYYRG